MTRNQALRDGERGVPRHAAPPRLRLVGNSTDDTVLRRQQFETAHPEIAINPPRTHTSTWTAYRDGELLSSQYQLAALLDTLDWLLAE